MKSLIKTNLVSVIIPTYNSMRFISTALESVANQTYKNIEIVVVDDCSSDATISVIREFMKRNSMSVTVYKFEKNMGVAYARNKAMELAHGQYIAFLDSDDYWDKCKIEKQLKLMNETGAEFCFSAIDMVNEQGEEVKSKRVIPTKVDYKFLLRNTVIPTSTVVIDRNKVGSFKMPLLRSGQDYATWLYLLRNGRIAVGVNEVLCHYRRTSDSLSSKKYRSIKQVWNIQTRQEHIKRHYVIVNTIFFMCNAFKKYMF